MPLDLNLPLADVPALGLGPCNELESPEVAAMLADLQPNIVHAHLRDHCYAIVLKFDPELPNEARRFLSQVGREIKSAADHLREWAEFKRSGRRGTPLLNLVLSAEGYRTLGVDPRQIPADRAFNDGMKRRQASLSDPEPAQWDEIWRGDIHGLLLIGGDPGCAEDIQAVEALKDRIIEAMPLSMKSGPDGVQMEQGRGMRSQLSPEEGVEHFGFVDGRSQPLFIASDLIEERDRRDGIHVWSPIFPLKQILAPDPGGLHAYSHGSYFVFRKLEQDVRGFRAAERALAEHMGWAGEQAHRAGASLIGRFRDGTPLALFRRPGANQPVPNNFDYGSDQDGIKCPFHAHMRKVNPRGETRREDERSHLLARRGVPYGTRRKHPNDETASLEELPNAGVGLLFMAYMSDISHQFEFMQVRWASGENFRAAGTGTDPIIGQGRPVTQRYRHEWGGDLSAPTTPFDMAGYVHLKGGEYFFAPSLSFLRTLADTSP